MTCCLSELCFPTLMRKSLGTKEDGPVQAPGVPLTAFTDTWENVSADGDLVPPKKYLPTLSP